jgi:predicted transport protein
MNQDKQIFNIPYWRDSNNNFKINIIFEGENQRNIDIKEHQKRKYLDRNEKLCAYLRACGIVDPVILLDNKLVIKFEDNYVMFGESVNNNKLVLSAEQNKLSYTIKLNEDIESNGDITFLASYVKNVKHMEIRNNNIKQKNKSFIDSLKSNMVDIDACPPEFAYRISYDGHDIIFTSKYSTLNLMLDINGDNFDITAMRLNSSLNNSIISAINKGLSQRKLYRGDDMRFECENILDNVFRYMDITIDIIKKTLINESKDEEFKAGLRFIL